MYFRVKNTLKNNRNHTIKSNAHRNLVLDLRGDMDISLPLVMAKRVFINLLKQKSRKEVFNNFSDDNITN